MSTVDEFHHRAMDLADEAFRSRRRGDHERAKELFLEALELERQAALLLPPLVESEPSRSILYRSAASLAYNGGDGKTADRMVAHGLSGFPPPEIEEELRNLYEEINFMRHLSAKGMELQNEQWLFTLAGNAVGYGKAAVDVLLPRVETLAAAFYRTVERLLKLPYRTTGSVSKDIKDQYGLFANALSPGSLAVSFQIGSPDPQLALFPDRVPRKPLEPSQIVDELLKCFEILEGPEPIALKEVIDDDMYYENFVGLAKQLAPDGNEVTLVGFTTVRNGDQRPVVLRKSRQQLRETPNLVSKQEEKDTEDVLTASYKGILHHAHSPISEKTRFGTVKLVDLETRVEHTIKVPIALMKDIVQPFYEERVSVLVHEKQGKKYLDDVSRDT